MAAVNSIAPTRTRQKLGDGFTAFTTQLTTPKGGGCQMNV
jgi:hypothetical protein